MQLFDYCLAPDTVGDGTGCDNMTAVLVKLRPAFETKPAAVVAEPSSATASSSTSSTDKTTPPSSDDQAAGATKREATEDRQPEGEEEQPAKKLKVDQDQPPDSAGTTSS